MPAEAQQSSLRQQWLAEVHHFRGMQRRMAYTQAFGLHIAETRAVEVGGPPNMAEVGRTTEKKR